MLINKTGGNLSTFSATVGMHPAYSQSVAAAWFSTSGIKNISNLLPDKE